MRLATRKKERENQLKGDGGSFILTKGGFEKLKSQILSLEEQHKQAVKDVQVTGEFGDFSENAEYQEAKHRMRNISSRLTTLKDRLNHVQIIEKDEQDLDRVQQGSVVTVESNGREQIFEIVGSSETNPLRGRVSYVSPFGKALIGHKVGDEISVASQIYQIKNIS